MAHRQNPVRYHSSQLSRPMVKSPIHSGGLPYDPRLSMVPLAEDTRSVRAARSLMRPPAVWNMRNREARQLDSKFIKALAN